LLRSAEVFRLIRRAPEFGLEVENPKVIFKEIQARKQKIIALLSGVRFERRLKQAGVTFYQGRAKFIAEHKVDINGGEVTANKFIIATGSIPAIPPINGLVQAGFITSNEALELEELPSSIIIIGGAAVGLEFATLFSSFGTKVTVVEMAERILPAEDHDISLELAKVMSTLGIEIYTNSQVRRVEAKEATSPASKRVVIQTSGGEIIKSAEEVMIATGRRAYYEHLDIENIGIEVEKKGIKVNKFLETSLPHVFAVGDVIPGMQLAHLSAYEGDLAAQNALLKERKEVDYRVVPRATFTYLEVGSVGMTEAEARSQGYRLEVEKYPFSGIGKAIAMSEREGFVKIISDKRTGEILGVHIIGPQAADMVHEGVIAMQGRVNLFDLAKSIHIHPTLSECFGYAVETAVEEMEKIGCCAA
jgi:dihydrolipoamide dehydrogenase